MFMPMCSSPACSQPALNTVHHRPAAKTGTAPLSPKRNSTFGLGDSADKRLPVPMPPPDSSSITTHEHPTLITHHSTPSDAHNPPDDGAEGDMGDERDKESVSAVIPQQESRRLDERDVVGGGVGCRNARVDER